jgi:hypothetical protein
VRAYYLDLGDRVKLHTERCSRKSTRRSSVPRRSCRSRCRKYDEIVLTDVTCRTIAHFKKAFLNIVPNSSRSELLQLHHQQADKLRAGLLSHTHAANMVIVARVLELPRELRDNVYSYLWSIGNYCDQDSNRDLIYWWDNFEQPWFEKQEQVSYSSGVCMVAMNLRPPHFVDKSFVGAKFAHKVLKRFKDTVGRDLRPFEGENPLAECGLIDVDMEDFVKKDVFGVGVTVEELVRNLDLRVTFECDALSGEDTDSEDNYLSELEDSVAALISIPYTDRVITHNESSRKLLTRPRIVTLAIRQESGFSDRSDLQSILKLVARAYRGLKENGFTIKVQYYSEEIGFKVLFEDDVWGWTSKDWTKNLKDKNTISNSHAEHADIAHNFQENVWKDLKEYLFQSHGTRELELR